MLKIGINGFGRIGRLAFRCAWDRPDWEIIQINDPAGDASTWSHLLNFDSIQGKWKHASTSDEETIVVDERRISCTQNKHLKDTDWSNCDLVIEASGQMKTTELLNEYLDQGVGQVVVTAPIKEKGILNLVVGVNHHLFDREQPPIVTASSCTTNCIAPVIKIIHEQFRIIHGSITTVHGITNTQVVLDSGHKDLRRARSSGSNLIPTTTGSAKAIAQIFPELEGKLNGHAIRVPLANASLTDCVFELNNKTSSVEVNNTLKQAAEGELKGILGFEERPLVSTDYIGDSRSSIVDALSTMVVNETQLKLYLWYDNEWGYSNRVIDLIEYISNA